MALSMGTRLGAYESKGTLGAGGMGEVYRARDSRLDRDVALKVIAAEMATLPAALARFEREARAVARLSHPNIVAIHDVGHVMHAVVRDEPDLTALASMPGAVPRVIGRCLEKQPRDRFSSAEDLAFALENGAKRQGRAARPTAPWTRMGSGDPPSGSWRLREQWHSH